MVLNKIISVIYQYLPKGIPYDTDAYWNSIEISRLRTLCLTADQERTKWNELIECLKKNLNPSNVVVDWTHLADLDRCYRLTLLLINNNVYQLSLVVSISLIVPYWDAYLSSFDVVVSGDGRKSFVNQRSIYDIQNIEFPDILKLTKECIEHNFNVEQLPKEFGTYILPDIELRRAQMGMVDIQKAAFSDYIL